MSGTTSIISLARSAPVRFCLLVACPVALAAAQLANSAVNGLPFEASVPFAAVLVAFAVLLAQHTRSTVRLDELDAGGEWPSAD